MLLAADRFDGAAYLCGYAVELALKARIVDTLGWTGFPDTGSEFKNYQSLRTHNLEVLLTFTGREPMVKKDHMAEWSEVSVWDPESRYKAIGTASKDKTTQMIHSADTLMGSYEQGC